MSSAERVFGHRSGFGSRPAVIVVDLSRAFTEPGSPLSCDVDGPIAAVATLVGGARASGHPLVFTTTAYTSSTRDAAAAFLAKTPFLGTLTPEHPLAQIDPRTGVRPQDALLVKPFASAFAGTSLSAILAAAHADTVVLAGASTSGCVRATAVDAVSHGFRTVIVREAVGDRDTAAHRQALLELDGRYADVESLEVVMTHLTILGKPDRA